MLPPSLGSEDITLLFSSPPPLYSTERGTQGRCTSELHPQPFCSIVTCTFTKLSGQDSNFPPSCFSLSISIMCHHASLRFLLFVPFILGIEPGSLHLAISSALVFFYFKTESHRVGKLPNLGSDFSPAASASQSAGITGVCHHTHRVNCF